MKSIKRIRYNYLIKQLYNLKHQQPVSGMYNADQLTQKQTLDITKYSMHKYKHMAQQKV